MRSTPPTIGGLSVVGVAGVGSKRGHLDVAGHDRFGAGRDPGLERRQLDALEPLARMLDDRQAEMRVDVGVAVPGKMLERGDHAGRLQAADVGRRERADLRRILAERARVDDRVARVVVDVDDRREVDVDADGARVSTPVTRPASNASDSSPAAPNAIARGNAVAPMMRKPTPASKSAVLSSGIAESSCSRFSVEAASSGWPSVTVP